MNKIIELAICIFIIISLLTVYSKVSEMNNDDFRFNPSKKIEMNKKPNQNNNDSDQVFKQTSNYILDNIYKGMPSDAIYIQINLPIELSFKTKKEIYDIRKFYVKKSIFAYNAYEPSDAQFGQIEDGKPWISIDKCNIPPKPSRINGPSEEARFINNPSILVGIDFPYSLEEITGADYCTDLLLPEKAYYDRRNKEIVTEYKSLLSRSFNVPYDLKGLNALDFGYRYVYLDKDKSFNVVEFVEKENITNTITELQDYIHLGGSCEVEGGCNNGSPYQPKLSFKHPKEHKPVILYLKLWKKMPESPDAPADINQKIIIKNP
ncbi:hypothetical protein IJ182_00270 [bacterium]|nr:hypothetical protein [bacterium]